MQLKELYFYSISTARCIDAIRTQISQNLTGAGITSKDCIGCMISYVPVLKLCQMGQSVNMCGVNMNTHIMDSQFASQPKLPAGLC